MTDSAAMQQPAVPGTLPCQAPPQVLQPCANLAPCAVASQLLASRPAGPVQAAPVQVAVAQTGNPTMAVANLIAGHSLARLPPAELALLIANHNGSDPALTQALQCAMSGPLRCPIGQRRVSICSTSICHVYLRLWIDNLLQAHLLLGKANECLWLHPSLLSLL